jgi:tetratricopeptide (TPR) repeat protein
MRAAKCFLYLTIILAFSVISVSGQAADQEALGRKAEQAGKLRQALTHYVSALQSDSEGSSTERRLREKIIRLARKIHPPPAVPEEAERHMARGRAAVKAAADEQGFTRAAQEFRKGLKAAPWLVDGYYNLGVVLDKAGKHEEAIENLKLYLVAVPDARDAKSLIYEIEYRKEEAQRQQRIQEEEKARLLARKKIKELDGGIFETDPDQLSHSGGYWTFKVMMQIDADKFKLINMRSREAMFRGTIGEDLSLKGYYIQDILTKCKKDEYGVWIDYFESYNKRQPMTGWISSDGERISLQFTSYTLQCRGTKGEGKERVNLHR